MKAPDPTHWTLNSRFGVFRTIWVHLRIFGCHTTLNAKRVKLVQKFVPRSLVGILSTQTHPIHPIGSQTPVLVYFLLFGCIYDCLVSLQNSVQNGKELVQKFMPRSPIGIFRN